MTVSPQARLRADARRNRDQILAAAKAAFAESGPDVPLEEIARRAGVGVGTLYRRFPERQALIHAVAQESFAAVLDDARAAAAEEPTRWAALVRLVGRSRDLRLGIRLALQSAEPWQVLREDPQTRRLQIEITEVLDGLVRGAQAEGTLRADVGTGDVAMLVSLPLSPSSVHCDRDTGMFMERALAVILDGLHTGAARPLPGRPITAGDLEGRPGQDLHSGQ